MQPEPTEVSQETSSTQSIPGIQNAYLQHGLQDCDEPDPRLLSYKEERDEPRCSVSEADASAPFTANLDDADETPLRRMRADSSPRTRSPVDRFAEYEKALNVSPKRSNEGPGFKIVEKSKKARENGSPIATFPNGMLSDFIGFVGRRVVLTQVQRFLRTFSHIFRRPPCRQSR